MRADSPLSVMHRREATGVCCSGPSTAGCGLLEFKHLLTVRVVMTRYTKDTDS